MTLKHFVATLGVLVLAAGCGSPPAPGEPKGDTGPRPSATTPAEVAPAVEPPRPMPELATGGTQTVVRQPLSVSISDAEQTGDIQTLRVEFRAGQEWPASVGDEPPFVRIVNAAGLQPRSFFEQTLARADGPGGTLWLRRRVNLGEEQAPLQVQIYLPTPQEDGVSYAFTLASPTRWTSKPKLFKDYMTALGRFGRNSPLGWLLQPSGSAFDPGYGDDWLSVLGPMRMLSSYESIEAALMWNDQLRASVRPGRATIPIESLRRPNLDRHPWQRMLSALPEVQYEEPLAEATPAAFYYVRVRSFEALQIVLDQADRFITPAVRLLDEQRSRQNLSERYRLQLALPSDGLSRVLGPTLVESLAAVGSDPFLRQGSDLTLIALPKDVSALRSALALKRAKLSAAFPLSASKLVHAGIEIERHASSDGSTVNQYSAVVQATSGKSLLLLSNSRAAIQRVIDTARGQHANLASELDFQYMMRRDPGVAEQLLVYFGDAFVQSSVEPARRVLNGRRQLAKAELRAPGHAALVHGWVYGRAPESTAELLATPWFDRKRLVHTTGEKISFEVGVGAQSSWGRPSMLTPIIDLPQPKYVTPEEKRAYESLVDFYQSRWSEIIDPIAIRVQPLDTKGTTELDMHVRVLPVMRGANYEELRMLAGGGGVQARGLPPGVSAALALGERSELRQMLGGQGRQFFGSSLKIDWLGDWVALGMADRVEFAEGVVRTKLVPRVNNREPEARVDEELLRNLPLYVAIDIKSRTGAGLFLGLLRKMLEDAAGDVFQWGKDGRVSGTDVIAVRSQDIELFYAITKRRVVASFNRDVLEDMIERDTEPLSEAKASRVDAPPAQLSFELNPNAAGSALMVTLAWMFEQAQREASGRWFEPEFLLSGAPEIASDPQRLEELSLAYTGAFPVTPDGVGFVMTESGVADPARGSAHAPVWPELPVPGSPLARVLELLRSAKSELAIDEEPGNTGEQSLRTRLRISLSRDAAR